MKEYTLEKFVELCNKCNYQVEKNPNYKDKAFILGKNFRVLYDCEKSGKNIDDVDGVEEDNRVFFKCLLKRRDSNGMLINNQYHFLQSENVVAQINVFEPFIGKIFNQKWHVLISLLALLDTANYDSNYNLPIKYNVKNIAKILIDEEKLYMKIVDDNGKCKQRYPSRLMMKWILEAIK